MHLEKFKQSAIGHMCHHYDRSQNIKSNLDIDKSKTYENYNLANNVDQVEFIKDKISQVGIRNKETVVMCSWVITLPKEIESEEEQKVFFKNAYEFMSNRYGRDNVISAYVHLDEKTPHMHFAFCPIVYDKKKKKYKFCAKDIISRNELRVIHTEMTDYMSKKMGHNIAILNGATKDGNLKVAELKMLNEKKERLEAELKSIVPDKGNLEMINLNLKRQNAILKNALEVNTKYKGKGKGEYNVRCNRTIGTRSRVRDIQELRTFTKAERTRDI